MRKVICAAIRFEEAIVCGARHYDKIMHMQLRSKEVRRPLGRKIDQGFIDQFGVFMDRVKALAVATASGQLVGRVKTFPENELFSEDLY